MVWAGKGLPRRWDILRGLRLLNTNKLAKEEAQKLKPGEVISCWWVSLAFCETSLLLKQLIRIEAIESLLLHNSHPQIRMLGAWGGGGEDSISYPCMHSVVISYPKFPCIFTAFCIGHVFWKYEIIESNLRLHLRFCKRVQ